MAEEFPKLRAGGMRPTAVAGSARADGVRFAQTNISNDAKVDWLVDTDLPAAKLQARAEELAKQGFHAEGVSSYVWDGAVRYCVVWLKEPPR